MDAHICPKFNATRCGVQPAEHTLDGSLVGVAAPNGQRLGALHFDDLRGRYGMTGSAAVRPDEAAFSELCSAKIPGDDEHNVIQLRPIDVIEDGLARCATGFSVIAHPEPLVAGAKPVGETVVPRPRMLLAYFRHKSHGRIGGGGRTGIADEAGSLDWVRFDVNTTREC